MEREAQQPCLQLSLEMSSCFNTIFRGCLWSGPLNLLTSPRFPGSILLREIGERLLGVPTVPAGGEKMIVEDVHDDTGEAAQRPG